MEIERQKKVIDMMITSHSVLKERYANLASLFEITMLIVSIILNTLVFVDSKLITNVISINEENQKLIIGLAAVLVFIISIVLLKVNWKEKSANHSRATEQLFILLQECRSILSLTDNEEKKIVADQFYKRYAQVTAMLPKIPDNKFNELKLIHYRKIELSKLIDKFPASRLFILKIKLLLSSFKAKK
ncbi:MAG: hypothetical protein ABI550_00525 [Ignavibacteriaceae bacterium]